MDGEVNGLPGRQAIRMSFRRQKLLRHNKKDPHQARADLVWSLRHWRLWLSLPKSAP
jgi:predicted nucleic acid-binding Zn ribbon protein